MAEPIKILISSAGTGSAISVIHALKIQKELALDIWACDTDRSAPGLFLADHGILAPSVSNPQEYLSFFLTLAETVGPYFLIPTLSREIALIASWQPQLNSHGIRTLLPTENTVRLCDDKVSFSALCESLRIPSPQIQPRDAVRLPAFVKPRIGSGSRGSGMARNQSEYDVLYALAKDPIVQEIIEGPEVTVDVLCRPGGTPLVISARQRVSVKNGQSVKGTTVPAEPFEAFITKACKRLEMVGPCNFQFILSPGRGPVLIEINPRFAAGGLALSVHAGANIPLLTIKLIMGMPISEADCQPRVGVNMTKYWSEVFWENTT